MGYCTTFINSISTLLGLKRDKALILFLASASLYELLRHCYASFLGAFVAHAQWWSIKLRSLKKICQWHWQSCVWIENGFYAVLSSVLKIFGRVFMLYIAQERKTRPPQMYYCWYIWCLCNGSYRSKRVIQHCRGVHAWPEVRPHSPEARVKHVHPRPAAARVFGAREDGVLLYRHVADEREDEQSHAEHDQAEGAEDAHHDALLSFPGGAPKQDAEGWTRQREYMHSYTKTNKQPPQARAHASLRKAHHAGCQMRTRWRRCCGGEMLAFSSRSLPVWARAPSCHRGSPVRNSTRGRECTSFSGLINALRWIFKGDSTWAETGWIKKSEHRKHWLRVLQRCIDDTRPFACCYGGDLVLTGLAFFSPFFCFLFFFLKHV